MVSGGDRTTTRRRNVSASSHQIDIGVKIELNERVSQ